MTLLVIRKASIAGKLLVTCNGAEALEYLFGRGEHEGRDAYEPPRTRG